MKKLLIFGASTLAKLAHYYATRDMGRTVLGFVVDDQYAHADSFLSLPVFRSSELGRCINHDDVEMHVAIGYRSMRMRNNAYQQAKCSGFKLANIVASNSFIADDVVMDDNNFVMPGVVIEPGSRIGPNNVFWSNTTVCHDTTIGGHNFIASNVTIGGETYIGNQNFLGFSSVILQQRVIGDEVLIGAQSLVLRDVESLSCLHVAEGSRNRSRGGRLCRLIYNALNCICRRPYSMRWDFFKTGIAFLLMMNNR